MLITRYHTHTVDQGVGDQVVQLVADNVSELSLNSVPPSNLSYDVFHWALPAEVGVYLSRIAEVPGEPVELLVAFDDVDTSVVTGFVLYSPVFTHPEACGVNYMCVRQSHRHRGIGSELMRVLIGLYPHTELTCTIKKVPFYESVGMQVIDSHNTQIVMNTRAESTTGMIAVLNVQPIYDSSEARAIFDRLMQRWGRKEMLRAEKQLARHTDQLERQAREFVERHLKDRLQADV
ncbi:putative acetyltransferase [Pseudomonas syringae pv. actinidiae ICMP 19103]|uniref:GNAT family N-acetyltransferase n=1 Tax=Pseudomonas syringae TaxID=317 RepID=UPI0003576166|nr:GNAT family N-acetyltransferase [Pseudomonas syringae]EPM64070.1 putative acetyltransferase [Pseudomonas syringae pv. actinidiae ICMP 19103]EPN07038.1 putative acetyltransferase [Pseudomonas syringae pv. actinidiae ICMP 19102]NVL24235.1 GNAT family N-acetyltransferase [Pseudomonas syringae pv. actinidiae]